MNWKNSFGKKSVKNSNEFFQEEEDNELCLYEESNQKDNDPQDIYQNIFLSQEELFPLLKTENNQNNQQRVKALRRIKQILDIFKANLNVVVAFHRLGRKSSVIRLYESFDRALIRQANRLEEAVNCSLNSQSGSFQCPKKQEQMPQSKQQFKCQEGKVQMKQQENNDNYHQDIGNYEDEDHFD